MSIYKYLLWMLDAKMIETDTFQVFANLLSNGFLIDSNTVGFLCSSAKLDIVTFVTSQAPVLSYSMMFSNRQDAK